MPEVHEAVQFREVRVPLIDPADTTGLVLGGFTVEGVSAGTRLATATTALGMTLAEIDAVNIAGLYEVAVTPPDPGLLFVRLTRGADVFDYAFQVQHEALDVLGLMQAGADGDFTITVDDGTDPVIGALVLIYDATGTKLLTRGTTDSNGQVLGSLPAGTYKTRATYNGYEAMALTTLTIVANTNVPPLLDVVLPGSAAEADRVALGGRFFAADAEVLFGEASPVIPLAVYGEGTLLVAVVPAALSGVVAVRVRKPDPDNPGEYLESNTVTMVAT